MLPALEHPAGLLMANQTPRSGLPLTLACCGPEGELSGLQLLYISSVL